MPVATRYALVAFCGFVIAGFLFVFFGWQMLPDIYERYGTLFVLWAGSTALTLLLLGRGSRWSRPIGIIVVVALGFFVFVPVDPTPYGTFTVCSSTHCETVSQYTSLSYVYLGTGAVYQTSGTYAIRPAINA